MDLLKHDITHEFPQLRDKIHTLKTTNHHFTRLYNTYDEINHTIAKIETGGGVMSDEALEDLKKQRLKLKDEIVQMLNAA